jgi:hypothetical protein
MRVGLVIPAIGVILIVVGLCLSLVTAAQAIRAHNENQPMMPAALHDRLDCSDTPIAEVQHENDFGILDVVALLGGDGSVVHSLTHPGHASADPTC